MASTNKTTNYELSQYVGSDKPTYLVDYNGDMLKIDTAIKNAYDRAGTGITDAAAAQATANTAASTATSAATAASGAAAAASTADGKAVTAQATADGAVASAATNALAIQAINNYLNVKNYVTPTVSYEGGITGSLDMRVSIARNDAGSLAKIYGFLGFTKNGTAGNVIVTLTNTGLNPDEAFIINPIGILRDAVNANYNPGYQSCTIKANGDIEFAFNNIPANRAIFVIIPACVYFIKNFGDVNN